MNFSQRTNWHNSHNLLTEILEARRKSGKPIFDLTASNPTNCGIEYPTKEILSAFSNKRFLKYEPDPRGLLSARETVAAYYAQRRIHVDPTQIFLTASTSEAYSYILKVLCNIGDAVLVPRPSYPLFDYLAQINDVALQHYQLFYDYGWHIDVMSIEQSITPASKAIIIINPHNPTGMFLKENEFIQIIDIAIKHDLAIIVDEVFIDYCFEPNVSPLETVNRESGVLMFTLNGISKLAGLPQMKISWLVIGGKNRAFGEVTERLEILSDTFLSVSTPVQAGLSKLMDAGTFIRSKILERVQSNYHFAQSIIAKTSACSLLQSDGGWYGIFRLPLTKSDEGWATELLENIGVYVFPGYFFDLAEDGYIVVSTLVEKEVFQRSIVEIVTYVDSHT